MIAKALKFHVLVLNKNCNCIMRKQKEYHNLYFKKLLSKSDVDKHGISLKQ